MLYSQLIESYDNKWLEIPLFNQPNMIFTASLVAYYRSNIAHYLGIESFSYSILFVEIGFHSNHITTFDIQQHQLSKMSVSVFESQFISNIYMHGQLFLPAIMKWKKQTCISHVFFKAFYFLVYSLYSGMCFLFFNEIYYLIKKKVLQHKSFQSVIGSEGTSC